MDFIGLLVIGFYVRLFHKKDFVLFQIYWLRRLHTYCLTIWNIQLRIPSLQYCAFGKRFRENLRKRKEA